MWLNSTQIYEFSWSFKFFYDSFTIKRELQYSSLRGCSVDFFISVTFSWAWMPFGQVLPYNEDRVRNYLFGMFVWSHVRPFFIFIIYCVLQIWCHWVNIPVSFNGVDHVTFLVCIKFGDARSFNYSIENMLLFQIISFLLFLIL